MIIEFRCSTKKEENYQKIYEKTIFSGGFIKEENKSKPTDFEFSGTLRIVAYGGTLYKEIKINKWADAGLHIIKVESND